MPPPIQANPETMTLHPLNPVNPDRRTQRIFRWLGGALVLSTLAACSSGPMRPPARMLTPEQLQLPDRASPSIGAQWWQNWGDARLQNLMAQALREHPSLAQAQARLERMQALAGVTRSASQPQAALSAEQVRQRYSEHGILPPPLAGHTWSNNTVQIGLGWNLDLWGEQRSALAAALGQARAAEADAALAAQVLSTQILRGSVGLARLLAQSQSNAQMLQVREQAQRLAHQRHAAGLDTRIDQALSETSLAEWQAQDVGLQEQIVLMRHQLATLCGLPLQALADYAPRLQDFALSPLPVTLGADLLGRRPDVVAARWRAEAAQDQVHVAQTQFYPSMHLGLFAGYNALGAERLLDAGSRQYGIAPAVRLPLFEGGRLHAQLNSREAERNLAVAQYNQTVLDAIREAADALHSDQATATQSQTQAQALHATRLAHALARQRAQAGLGNQLSVLNAQAAEIAQERVVSDLFARQLDVRVQLIKALGGGWETESVTPGSTTHTAGR